MSTEFNPNLTTNLWIGIDLSKGLAADSSIVYSFNSDVASYTAGASSSDGVTTLNSDLSGTITLQVQYGSKTAERLAAALAYQKKTGKRVKGAFITKNPDDSIRASGKRAYIMTRPDVTYSSDAGNQSGTWVFGVEEMDIQPASTTSNVTAEVEAILSNLT